MIDTENIVLKNIREIIQTISFKLSYQITQTRETILSYLLSVTTMCHHPVK